jgi:putative methyltransferase (TIGR04325 family)
VLAAGWDVPEVVEAYSETVAHFREATAGSGPLADATSPGLGVGAGSVGDQNAILVFGYGLALASRCSKTVSILDWGGGAGVFYLLSQALLAPAVDVKYHCKDLPRVCAYGREALPEVLFHDDDSCLESSYDLVLASNSLQYEEEWRPLLGHLARAAQKYLLLIQVPIVASVASFVVVQRVYRHGLGSEYLSWVFNRDELLEAVSYTGMEFVREFLFAHAPILHGAPEQQQTRGFLFRHD